MICIKENHNDTALETKGSISSSTISSQNAKLCDVDCTNFMWNNRHPRVIQAKIYKVRKLFACLKDNFYAYIEYIIEVQESD